MDAEYDKKYADMKKYIPFLEKMVGKLEDLGAANNGNPRQAQLYKIRALRDLLLDQNKRMKIDNLLKCEQVLINLHAKVEQGEPLPQENQTFNSDLDNVRQKLKNVTQLKETYSSQSNSAVVENENALFQRRPHKISPTTLSTTEDVIKSVPSASRNYTRVLVSPEPSDKRWKSEYKSTNSENHLFNRRSPKHFGQLSPNLHRKEKKRSSKRDRSRRSSNSGINITVNVPAQSLNGLNRENLVDRIMSCRDNDVNIDQLTILRNQILKELNHTGTNKDISNLILKSYNKKKVRDKKRIDEIEEGELSDSESESIEQVYGNLIIEIENDLNEQDSKNLSEPHKYSSQIITKESQESQKIKINLVISNADKKITEMTTKETQITNTETTETDKSVHCEDLTPLPNVQIADNTTTTKHEQGCSESVINLDKVRKTKDLFFCDTETSENTLHKQGYVNIDDVIKITDDSSDINKVKTNANFYKPLSEQTENNDKTPLLSDSLVIKCKNANTSINKETDKDQEIPDKEVRMNNESPVQNSVEMKINQTTKTDDNSAEQHRVENINKDDRIPFLSESDQNVKEGILQIDILKALKNEILGEDIHIPGTNDTPPLHQPKITKVADKKTLSPNKMHTIYNKKRITLEKYKEKSISASKTPLFVTEPSKKFNNDNVKKPSVALTEKECERFNFLSYISSDDDDTDVNNTSVDDVYNDLAPRSPDDKNKRENNSSVPIIIPTDSPKNDTDGAKSDIDMRLTRSSFVQNPTVSCDTNKINVGLVPEVTSDSNQSTIHLEDNRFPGGFLMSPRGDIHLSNPTISKVILSTPTYSNTTPTRDFNDQVQSKHVYTPTCDPDKYSFSDDIHVPQWELNNIQSTSATRELEPARLRDPRSNSIAKDDANVSHQNDSRYIWHQDKFKQWLRNDRNLRSDYSEFRRPSHYYEQSEFDCPSTPSHPYGRSEYPSSSSHSFRRDSSPPSHKSRFVGRTDPRIQSNTFGRSDSKSTFQSTDYPPTPSHPFGRYNTGSRFNRSVDNYDDSGYGYTGVRQSHNNSNNESNSENRYKHFNYNDVSYNYDDTSQRGFTREHKVGQSYTDESYRSIREQSIPKRESTGPNWELACITRDRNVSGREPSLLRRERSVSRTDLGAPSRERSISRTDTQFTSIWKPNVDFKIEHGVHGRERSVSLDFSQRVDQTPFYEEPHKPRHFRSQSVGRSLKNEYDCNNTLSVKAHDRSFVIDSSVNRTFQSLAGYANKDIETFNQRRRRASSVGRFPTRESSVGKSLHKRVDLLTVQNNILVRPHTQNVKINDSSQSYSEKTKDKKIVYAKHKVTKNDISEMSIGIKGQRDLRKENRIDNWTKIKSSKTRGRHLSRDKSLYDKNKYKIYDKLFDNRSVSRDNRKSGIVYTSDNIANGTVLRSGDKVKNYKIPKIKRVETITTENTSGQDKEPKNDKNKKLDIRENKTCDNVKEKNVKCISLEEKVLTREDLRYDEDKNTEKNDLLQKTDLTHERLQSNKNTTPEKTDLSNEDLRSDKDKSGTTKNNELLDKTDFKHEDLRSDKDKSTRPGKQSNRAIQLNLKKNEVGKVARDDNDTISSRTRNGKSRAQSFELNVETKVGQDINLQSCASPKMNTKANKCDEPGISEDSETSFAESDLPLIDNALAYLDQYLSSSKHTTELEVEDSHFDNHIKETMTECVNTVNDTKELNTSEIQCPNKDDNITMESECTITGSTMEVKETHVLNDTNLSLLEVDNPNKTTTHENEITNYDISTSSHPSQIIKTHDNETFIDDTSTQPPLAILTKADSNTNNENLDKVENVSSDNKIIAEIDSEVVSDVIAPAVVTSDFSRRNKDVCEDAVSVHDISFSGSKDNTEYVEMPAHKLESIKQVSQSDCSTTVPDSTIFSSVIDNVEPKINIAQSLADSTNEIPVETNIDISSTNENKECLELATDNKQSSSKLDSLGSLLSILKDKSKMKELLSMLDDKSSESDKIKRKLEKLTEIVSDEEDTPNIITKETCSTKDDKVTDDEDHIRKSDKDEASKDLFGKSSDVNISDENVDTTDLDSSIEKSVQRKPTNKTKTKRKMITRKRTSTVTETSTVTGNDARRVTRSGLNQDQQVFNTRKPKVTNRELKKLQVDFNDIFTNDNSALNATGLRMCRLAKLVDENNMANKKIDIEDHIKIKGIKKKPHVGDEADKNISPKENETMQNNSKNNSSSESKNVKQKPIKKKLCRKLKVTISRCKDDPIAKNNLSVEKMNNPKYKSGPKSKNMASKTHNEDPYAFESDAVSETTKASESSQFTSSESDDESLASFKSSASFGPLNEIKSKVKRKRSSWQLGIIKNKSKKKKLEKISTVSTRPDDSQLVPDTDFFVDKSYCFNKNESKYLCKFCIFEGSNIVHHYRLNHPHYEVPLSRINEKTSSEAIKQSLITDFQTFKKVITKKHVCRFCFEVFDNKNSNLESFFKHVVHQHTGEYRQQCPQCINLPNCAYTLDIPSPPQDDDGLLLGYICGECNYTQISLENLKTHVAVRHDNEQTAVYAINIGDMTQRAVNALSTKLRKYSIEESTRSERILRSKQNCSATKDEMTDDSFHTNENEDSQLHVKKPVTIKNKPCPASKKIQSRILFDSEVSSENEKDSPRKIFRSEVEQLDTDNYSYANFATSTKDDSINAEEVTTPKMGTDTTKFTAPAAIIDKNIKNITNDPVVEPHFKVNVTATGGREYICCINSNEHHYVTTLLISMKKHVQKHKEVWDGYCCLCKVIVTPQGHYYFKDCLTHFLDNHMDEFPIVETPISLSTPHLEEAPVAQKTIVSELKGRGTEFPVTSVTTKSSPIAYINVRPLSELVSTEEACPDLAGFPRIESVVSLHIDQNLIEPALNEDSIMKRPLQDASLTAIEVAHEVTQLKIMEQKHQVVVQTMLVPEKLVQLFKCAGNYCSFSSDSPEGAILHASTHQRIGGLGALRCTYCPYNVNNGIDLVSHILREHGHCQFFCKLCFYLATAASLVEYHVKRVHTSVSLQGSVLKAHRAASENSQAKQLTRSEAVPMYICNNDTELGRCKFQHYTPGKFSEHLNQRHGKDSTFNCSYCSQIFGPPSGATALIEHLRDHGLHLYQCIWCVHGASSEKNILEHMSLMHPCQRPNAYLRHIIESNDSNTKPKVLPMVNIDKSTVAPLAVGVANVNSDSPIKEAERAMELESLIGATNAMIECRSMANLSTHKPASTPEVTDNCANDTMASLTSVSTEPDFSSRVMTATSSSNIIENNQLHLSTLASSLQTAQDPKTSMAIDKPIPVEAPKTDIVCLESDEDNQQLVDVINLSDEEDTSACQQPNTSSADTSLDVNRQGLKSLYKCAKCRVVFKTVPAFKSHSISCYLGSFIIDCAYCSYSSDRDKMVNHYQKSHGPISLYVCSKCMYKNQSKTTLRQHMLSIHSINKIVIKQKGAATYFMDGEKSKVTQPKQIAEPIVTSSAEPPPIATSNTVRYSPADIDKLPINSIFKESVYCAECKFNTKVRLNMIRHLQKHANQLPVAHTAPVNPVPHLETNEKHFDKMTNLAASSNALKTLDKSRATTSKDISFENAQKFPQFVPAKKRLACGAIDCSYISVDEAMLTCHWEALHAGSLKYRCVHCPPTQKLVTSQPITAPRIISHLKMHGACLYVCSCCQYYHFQKSMVEKHLPTCLKNGLGTAKVLVLRENASIPLTAPAQTATAAPTMDLKAWQCGLCEFKSMLRQKVVEHCAQLHQSRFEFKCGFCQWRNSSYDSVIKHHSTCHSDKVGEVFYFYYKEGSVPNEADGTPRWMKQRKCMESYNETEIKCEVSDNSTLTKMAEVLPSKPTSAPPVTIVDLNLVKTEVLEGDDVSLKTVKGQFVQFCEPKGNKYVCPFCKDTLDTKEIMSAHLYEELKYRKWCCGICPYNAFHKIRLMEHMFREHRKTQEPIELPSDVTIENWVSKLLEHQEQIMLLKPPPAIEKATAQPAGDSAEVSPTQMQNKFSPQELVQAFGSFGSPREEHFVCPICKDMYKEEAIITDHLELELAKVRWGCSQCSDKFNSFHEVQLHCKAAHIGKISKTVGVSKDPELRQAWIAAVVQHQKLNINNQSSIRTLAQKSRRKSTMAREPSCNTSDNSLLVVRYEENIPTPEEMSQPQRKRPLQISEHDSDDERLIIDEIRQNKTPQVSTYGKSCPFCEFTTKSSVSLRGHILRHYGLKPFVCGYCPYSNYKPYIYKHLQSDHPDRPESMEKVSIPDTPPMYMNLTRSLIHSKSTDKRTNTPENKEMICLTCEKSVADVEADEHMLSQHGTDLPLYVSKGTVVFKCCICFSLSKDKETVKAHHDKEHPGQEFNYSLFKMVNHKTRDTVPCGYCNKKFRYVRDLRAHYNAVHCVSNPSMNSPEPSTSTAREATTIDVERHTATIKRKLSIPSSGAEVSKKVARKSTSKLPTTFCTTARKSTTKLPLGHDSEMDTDESSVQEYSYYGTKPRSLNEYSDLTTQMPFFGTLMPFTVQKLSAHMNLSPKVLVKDDVDAD